MRRIGIAGALLLAAPLAGPAWAQAPVGPPFMVNTYTTGDQSYARVSLDPATGRYMVVWRVSDSGVPRVAGQRYDVDGTPLGVELRISDLGANADVTPAVAHDGAGRAIVAWVRRVDLDIFVVARRFDAAGNAGPEFLVNTYTTGNRMQPTVAADASGRFVVVWASFGQDGSDFGVFGRRFDGNGIPQGAEFQVNTYTTGRQAELAADMDDAGNFVVIWSTGQPNTVFSAVEAQRFNASGARVGGEFKVNTHTTSQPVWHDVAVAPDGRFVVVWQDYYVRQKLITTRRYDASGAPLAPESFIGSPGSIVGRTRTTVDASGRFVHVWPTQDVSNGNNQDVVAQRFDADGARRGRVFAVASAYPDVSRQSWSAMDDAGRLVVVWEREPVGSFQSDIWSQRYGLLDNAALAVDTVAGGNANGNGVLEPGESVNVRPSWGNNTGVPQDLAGMIAGLSGPPGATYTITDATGAYGTVPAGAIQPCSDCYGVAVTAPASRPVAHWDAQVRETIGVPEAGHSDWSLHVGDSFTDVPRTNPFYRFVEAVLHHGITNGCAAGQYCPSAVTTREQMAPFVLLARESPRYRPPTCSSDPMFPDVPTNSPFCPWVEELARRGVTSGCGGGNYCPNAAVSREQMAVFVLRTLDPNLNPPACTTPVFNDVPASAPYCRWIEELARRGIVSGCGSGNYCPTAPVTREQMSVFLTGTFGLTLYGP